MLQQPLFSGFFWVVLCQTDHYNMTILYPLSDMSLILNGKESPIFESYQYADKTIAYCYLELLIICHLSGLILKIYGLNQILNFNQILKYHQILQKL